MARLGVVRAGITALIALGVAVLGILGLTAATSGASQSASIALLALDANPGGNSARSVGAVEECVSANVGQPEEIDIVAPNPGIPADRGIAAYQFSIMYDPAVVWIDADDSGMLLAQAAGSNVIPIADPKPDKNGVYQSWGVDFGASGIEPAGSSEVGPGVIARITLLPRAVGVSNLTLSGVLVIDDQSQRIPLDSLQSGAISIGEPCPEQSGQTASPTVSTPTPEPPAAPVATTPLANTASTVPEAGGAPPAAGGGPAWLIVYGLMAALSGAGLLIIGGPRQAVDNHDDDANSLRCKGQ